MPSIGFAPLMASHWPLDAADAVVTASAAPFGAAAARKGSPQPPPTSFIPVPGAAKLQQPGAAPRLKLRPHSSSSGGGAHPLLSPSLQLPHPGVGLSFSIHAYGRPLTQLDFISTGGLAALAAGR